MPGKPRVLVVINPVSGRGSAAAAREAIAGGLVRRGLDVEVVVTTGPGEAERLAAAAVGKTDVVVAAGGDGTLNEVARGILARAEGRPAASLPALSMVPFGTGNVAVFAFGIPRRLEAVLDTVAAGRSRELDVGAVTRSGETAGFFLLWLGAGLDGALIHAVAAARTGPIAAGILHYVLPALRTFARYRFPAIEIEVDGVRQPACAQAILANVGKYAVVGNVVPRADPSDGLIDVVWAGPRPRLAWIGPALATLPGWLESCRGIRLLRGRRVSLGSAAQVPVQIDGEAAGLLPLEVEVRPRAIRLLVP